MSTDTTSLFFEGTLKGIEPSFISQSTKAFLSLSLWSDVKPAIEVLLLPYTNLPTTPLLSTYNCLLRKFLAAASLMSLLSFTWVASP
nr:MAG: hypothetical protein [Bacteriophage sp.]